MQASSYTSWYPVRFKCYSKMYIKISLNYFHLLIKVSISIWLPSYTIIFVTNKQGNMVTFWNSLTLYLLLEFYELSIVRSGECLKTFTIEIVNGKFIWLFKHFLLTFFKLAIESSDECLVIYFFHSELYKIFYKNDKIYYPLYNHKLFIFTTYSSLMKG